MGPQSVPLLISFSIDQSQMADLNAEKSHRRRVRDTDETGQDALRLLHRLNRMLSSYAALGIYRLFCIAPAPT